MGRSASTWYEKSRIKAEKTVNSWSGVALSLLCPLVFLHIVSAESRYYTSKFVQLSYYNKDSRRYALGPDDFLFLCFWIVLLTGLRAGVIDYILIPLAAWAGIETKKAKVRFAEQAWLLCHHGTSWSCGMVSRRFRCLLPSLIASSTYGTTPHTG